MRARAARPTVRVETATEHARVPVAGAPDRVDVVELPRDGRRPKGRRFGSLVHATLATVPLDADGARVRQVVELQARVLGAPPEETEGRGARSWPAC